MLTLKDQVLANPRAIERRSNGRPLCLGEVQSNILSHPVFQRLGLLNHEELHVYFLGADPSCAIKGVGFDGETDQVHFCSRTILRHALLSGAYQLLLAHNHPSGDPSPSPRDIEVTKVFARGCQSVGLRLYDHVIATKNEHFSFRGNGLM